LLALDAGTPAIHRVVERGDGCRGGIAIDGRPALMFYRVELCPESSNLDHAICLLGGRGADTDVLAGPSNSSLQIRRDADWADKAEGARSPTAQTGARNRKAL